MIYIVDDSRRRSTRELRRRLAALYIPSLISDCEHIKRHSGCICAVVFASSSEMLNLSAVRCGSLPIIAVNESGGRIYNPDAVFFDEKKDGGLIEFIIDFMSGIGVTAGRYSYGALKFDFGTVSYGMNYVKLTKTESMILAAVMLSPDAEFTEDDIINSCFSERRRPGKGCVSVHICNINRKAKLVTGRAFIKGKRGRGYSLNRSL